MTLAGDKRVREGRERLAAGWRLAVRILFGTRLGVVLFLGTVVFAGLYWRVGIFITDNYTLGNALVALSDGQLFVERVVYGPGLETPGMKVYEGQTYARNYGQLAFALPVLWLLEGLRLVVDPGLLIPTLWSLAVVALCVQTGRVIDRPATGRWAGAVVGLGAFAANAAVARPLAADQLPLVALQTSAVVATGLAAVTLYRWLTRMHGQWVGLSVGVALVAATPVGFWASIPKRHVYVVALLVGICYAFYRSREETDPDALLPAVGFRGLTYGLVGLLTWVHAGEAFAVFLALVIVDVPTAPSNDRRSIAVVAGAFGLSLLPFLLTNVMISGDPLRPPRMLRSFGDLTGDGRLGSGGGSSGGGDTGSAGSGRDGLLPPFADPVVSEALARWTALMGPFQAGIETVLEEPRALFQTFLRGGYIDGVAAEDNNQAINLSVVESAPLFGGISALGVALGTVGLRGLRRVRNVEDRERLKFGVPTGPVRAEVATDAFVALAGVLFALMYVQRLPLHAQVTARYLLPLFPLGLYALARLAPLRRALDAHGRTALWTWLGGVLLGAQLFVVVVAVGSLGRGEAFQVHALAGLGAGALLAVLACASVLTDRFDRATAAAAGLAAALGTDLLVLSGFVYFQYGQYALPASGALADLLSTV